MFDTTTFQSFDTYIAPTMSLADIVIPQGAENFVALQLITQHVKRELDRCSFMSPVSCHLFHVTCFMSCVSCHAFHVHVSTF